MSDYDYLDSIRDQRTPCEIWSRVMGYHRPVAQFNTGKQQEHKDRRFFQMTENMAQACCS